MTNDKNTSLTLLLRWLSGEANRRDEQQLDALAKDEPFLADALDGYRALPQENHAAAVTKLKAQLRSKQQKRSRGAGFYLLRAAAIGAMLVTAWIVFRNFDTKEMPLAQNESAVAKEIPTAPSASSVPELNAQFPDSNLAAAENEVSQKERLFEKNAGRPVPQRAADESVLGQQTQPSPAANQSTRVEQKPTTTSPNTDFKITETDDALAGAKAKKEEPSARDAAKIAAPTANPEARKSASEKSESLQKDSDLAIAYAEEATTLAQPENWEEYLSKNLRYPPQAAKNGIEGEVKLSFHLENDGTPKDIMVVKSLGYGCDEEAKRLLRQGPKWQAAPDVLLTCNILFLKK